MRKRASVKGKGADIFFGDYEQELPASAPIPPTDQVVVPDTSVSPSSAALEEPTATDLGSPDGSRKEERKFSRNLENQKSRKPENVLATDFEEGRQFDINERTDLKVGFLFTPQEFDAVEEVKLSLRRRLNIRVSKNDVVRCALHHLIEDYQEHGDESILAQRLRTKKP